MASSSKFRPLSFKNPAQGAPLADSVSHFPVPNPAFLSPGSPLHPLISANCPVLVTLAHCSRVHAPAP